MKEAQNFESIFFLPLSQQAHSQLQQLLQLVQAEGTTEAQDAWRYIWNNQSFSVKKAYKQLSGHSTIPQAFSWLWKSSCQNKHKVFFWLVMKDRISTRQLLRNQATPVFYATMQWRN